MSIRNEILGLALLILIMIIAVITAIIAIMIIAFKINTLLGIIILCAAIYGIILRIITVNK